MNDIEIWELKFKANVAINTQYTDEETVAIHDAIVSVPNGTVNLCSRCAATSSSTSLR